MDILELNFERTWRGGERQTIYNMAGFRNAGLQVALVCRKGYPLAAKAKEEGFTVFEFNNIFGVLFFLLFQGGKYDFLHAQTSHILTYCVFAKPFHKAKIIFSRRVNFMPHGRLTKWKYDRTDNIVAVSESVKKVLLQFGVKEVSVISDVVVRRQLNKDRAVSFIKDQGIPADKHIIGTIAAMGPDKDPLTMVEAIRLLAEKRKDFVFLHFGAGKLEGAVREQIKQYGLEDVYRLMGFQDDVEDFYTIFEVFVMSSQQEGLGSSVLDAYLYKVPVVSTNAGGLADLLEESRGIACEKGDASGLAVGIDFVLSQPQLATQMSDKAYDFAISHHNLQYITDQYLDLFKRSLA